MKHPWKTTMVLGLVCAVLAAGFFWQYGRLSRLKAEMAELNVQVQRYQTVVQTQERELKKANDRITELENGEDVEQVRAPLVTSYRLRIQEIDTARRTATLHLEAELDVVNLDAEAELVVWQTGASSRVQLRQSEEGRYEGTVTLSMEAPEQGAYFQVSVTDGGRSRLAEICSLASLTDLLDVQLLASSGEAEFRDGALYFTGWQVKAENAAEGSETMRIYRNGELLQEFPATAIMDFNQACDVGDTVELCYAAAGQWGLRYEYSLKWWEITDTGAVLHWPVTASPTLLWEE